jgi:hypothetical protein
MGSDRDYSALTAHSDVLLWLRANSLSVAGVGILRPIDGAEVTDLIQTRKTPKAPDSPK